MKIIDYHCTLGVTYRAEDVIDSEIIATLGTQSREHGKAWSAIPIAECLTGTKWDALALAYVSAFKPTSIRVTNGEIKCNSSVGRVTVYVTEDDTIHSIEQACSFDVSNTLCWLNGHELMQKIQTKVETKNALKGN